jgi:spectinomycin phosphotransferase/16S rRNA (guanine(1405)-N(7))-methyltransferase
VARLLGEGWDIVVAEIEYRPVGFGSHHWEAVDVDGRRWFVTADDLDSTRSAIAGARDEAFARLRTALVTAHDLRVSGANFVVAPIPTVRGEPLMLGDHRFGVACYPHVDGESFTSGEFSTRAHRRGVLDLIVDLHATPTTTVPSARTDDFALHHRSELESTLRRDDIAREAGPYGSLMTALIARHMEQIRRQLVRYDLEVEQLRQCPRRNVVTHGEPHAANTMHTSEGWVLIDWDTALLAPPERDLWILDSGDGRMLDQYADATGERPDPTTLELYRIRWDLADMGAYVSRFRAPHSDTQDDQKSWDELRFLVERTSA